MFKIQTYYNGSLHVALPSWFDVGKAVLHKQLEMANNSTSNNTKNVKLTTIFNQVADEIQSIWDKGLIPCNKKYSISRMISGMWDKRNTYVKINKDWSNLFDIAACT